MICINVVNTHPIITGKHDPTMSGKHRPAIDTLRSLHSLRGLPSPLYVDAAPPP